MVGREKVGLFPIVSPAHVAAGVSAKEWCDHAIAAAVAAGGSGKGGGKAEQANANIVLPTEGGAVSPQDTVHNVLEAAKTYAAARVKM